MTGIRPMQVKGCKFADEMVRCTPDLYVGVMGDSDKSSVRRKADSLHRLFEVMVMEYDASANVNEQCSPICTA